MTERVDVAIVGAGTAGLAALREVRKRTDDFVLINAPPYGTTCARVGCMPSKALIAAANAFHARARFDEFGIRGGDHLSTDIPAVLARVRRLRDRFVSGVLETTEGLDARRITGSARLDGPNRVIVGGRTIEARRIVLAPGSSPIVPKPWQAFENRLLTTDTLFEAEDLPPRIGVIGLGAIGVEMAQALSRLGLEVHGFDGAERMAGIGDERVADTLKDALGAEFAIHLGVEVDLAEVEGGVEIRWDDGRVVVDQVLVAVGRQPNIAELGLDTLNVPLDDHGMPDVDPETMQIGDTPVLLAGDADGMHPILHEGADDGHIAGLNATRDTPLRLPRRTRMNVAFCNPQVAAVGRQPGDQGMEDCLTGEVDFANQGRARMMQENCGLLRVHAAREDGRLLGAEMAAPAAEHLAHMLALAVDRQLTVHDMLRMPFYHPTLEEGLRSALRDIASDLPACSLSDLAGCDALGTEALD